MWSLIHPADMTPYIALVRRNYNFRPGYDELLSPYPDPWAEQGNAIEQSAPSGQLTSVMPADPTCRGIRLFVIDGRVQPNPNDLCCETGKNRLQLADGTICYGWPTAIIIDRPDGREIVA